ncbi:E3 ubiquitin-protein ligase SDIR1 [Vitis vinifera]|uniref:RING-type E3 ubiquitin transferase n=1 Tax=Vitis vinifera TaxID=29760 RepID=A0A438JXU7_VITVI|nr:E3 ubiquitin-protein ligase SDIR1 [Vitis vinifera]
MSFVFRGSRADIESGFPGFIPERRAVRVHAARPVNTNSLAFLVTVLLLFMILNSHQMSPNFLIWLVLGIFLMATTLRMYATCQQLQAQAQAHAAAASGLLGHTELRLHMPPSIALATRGRLQGLRLQLALLDREFDDLDYETLRALDSENVPTTPSMSEEEINALPVHKYKVAGTQGDYSDTSGATLNPYYPVLKTELRHIPYQSRKGECFSLEGLPFGLAWLRCSPEKGIVLHWGQSKAFVTKKKGTTTMETLGRSGNECYKLLLNAEILDWPLVAHQCNRAHLRPQLSVINFTTLLKQKKQDINNAVASTKAPDDELTCSVCLEQVNVGELIRSLPCLHQFHANCIDPWLRQQGTCPVCKFRAAPGWQENGQGGMDASYMV